VSLEIARPRGDRRSQGRIQGEAFGPLISDAVDFYRDLGRRNGWDLDAMGERSLRLVELARTRAPGAVEELEGIAEGSEQDPSVISLLNCLEEVWPAEACTTMIADRFLLHAEQWYGGHDGVGVVVAEPGDGPAFVSPTCVGFLPAVGLNASGFAQGIDSLSARDDGEGVPRVIVSREALGAPGLDAAVAASTMPGRAGGYAHVFASGARHVIVETSRERAFVLEDTRAHTNHYLADDAGSLEDTPSRGSVSRLRRARALLAGEPPRSIEDCMRALADHEGSPQAICLHGTGEDDATVFGMVCDVVGGVMVVSDGAPCAGRWTEVAVPGYRSSVHVV
jgi:Acyl-coenzyme A:6-aminopenicillanic acid acyl-transferase